MKTDDKEFIKRIIQDDINIIPNTDFTSETVLKIRETGSRRQAHSEDYKLLFPVFIYAFSFIMASVLGVFNLLVLHAGVPEFNKVLRLTSDMLFDPVIVSICISSLILYYLDSFLDRSVFLRKLSMMEVM